jgi:hypothetical protein
MRVVPAQRINVGAWIFYPELMVAQNMHNGTVARMGRTDDGGWAITCINCPAEYMMKQLGDWFFKWITGTQP